MNSSGMTRPDEVAHLSFQGSRYAMCSVVPAIVAKQFEVRMPIARTFAQTGIHASHDVPIQVQMDNKGAGLP